MGLFGQWIEFLGENVSELTNQLNFNSKNTLRNKLFMETIGFK